MTYPRAHTVNPQVSGVYHCVSRCVRRAWLCGTDELSGRSFEHRKRWIENRLLELSSVFALELWGYAVMSNHYHIVVRTQPERVADWTDLEVATRWMSLCNVPDALACQRRIAAITGNPEWLAVLRGRLGNLSWFMRYLNEPLARRANREDGCTGRFWQGRFRSEALLDDGAVLAAMAYVDLNPVRAGMVESAEKAKHTGLARRLDTAIGSHSGLGRLEEFGLTTSQYASLVRWTAQIDVNVGCPQNQQWPFVRTVESWRQRLRMLERHCRAQGTAPLLRMFARVSGQKWVKGVAWAPSG